MTRFRQALREGLIGEVVEMRAYGKQDTRAGGEDLMVLGSHLMDIMRAIAGDPISCTSRVLQQGRPITKSDARLVKDNVGLVAGDEVFANFAFTKGVNATFTSAARLKETFGEWGIEILGSKGAARINCDVPALVFIRRSGKWTAAGRTDNWVPLDAKDLRTVAETKMNPVSDWLEAIAKNREPECSGRNGAWAVEMVMAVYHSALNGGAGIPFPLKTRTHPLAG
jgi:predicted dehydrogenase